jgi:hypothetical protein
MMPIIFDDVDLRILQEHFNLAQCTLQTWQMADPERSRRVIR